MFDAQIRFQPQTPKPHQNPKSHLKIRNLTSKSKISPQNPKSQKTSDLLLNVLFQQKKVVFQLFKDAPSEALIFEFCWGTKSDACVDVIFLKKWCFCCCPT